MDVRNARVSAPEREYALGLAGGTEERKKGKEGTSLERGIETHNDSAREGEETPRLQSTGREITIFDCSYGCLPRRKSVVAGGAGRRPADLMGRRGGGSFLPWGEGNVTGCLRTCGRRV